MADPLIEKECAAGQCWTPSSARVHHRFSRSTISDTKFLRWFVLLVFCLFKDHCHQHHLDLSTAGDAVPLQRLSRGVACPGQRHPWTHGRCKLLPGNLQHHLHLHTYLQFHLHLQYFQLDGLLHFCEVRCASLIDLDTIVSYYIHAKVTTNHCLFLHSCKR